MRFEWYTRCRVLTCIALVAVIAVAFLVTSEPVLAQGAKKSPVMQIRYLEFVTKAHRAGDYRRGLAGYADSLDSSRLSLFYDSFAGFSVQEFIGRAAIAVFYFWCGFPEDGRS